MKLLLPLIVFALAVSSCSKEVEEPIAPKCKSVIYWLDIYSGNWWEPRSTWKYVRSDTSIYFGVLCGAALMYFDTLSRKQYQTCWDETNFIRLEIK